MKKLILSITHNRKLRRLVTVTMLLLVIVTALLVLKDFILYPSTSVKVAAAPTLEYGIVTDSLSVLREEVKVNETLGSILTGLGADVSLVNRIHLFTEGVFDIRKLRQGNLYTAMFSTSKEKKLRYFIYEISDTNYVVFDFRDSLYVHKGNKEVEHRLQSASGKITSSLWNAIQEAGADPSLAIALADIYQWSIDFYAIQKDDEFKAIYEELSVEGKPAGLGIIHAAWFRHAGREYYAYRFHDNDKVDYFNEKGENVRREFLKAPLKFSRISSKFSHSRLHPVLRIRRPHHGVDYAAPRGTPVHTIGSGTVIRAGYAGGAGRMVTVRHNSTYSTSYLHLAGFGPGIRTGAHVNQGQLIGFVGSSGLSTGPHLDFRFYKNGTPVDPLRVESPPALPVSRKNRPVFDSIFSIYGHNLQLIR